MSSPVPGPPPCPEQKACLVPPTDVAPSPEVVARLRSLIDLATPFAIRVAASRGVAELEAGVHERDGGRMYLPYNGLLHSVRTGEVAYPVVHGRTFWEDLDAEPHRRFIDELMLVQGSRTSPQAAELYDWSAVTDVVDVGGGSGGLLAELLGRHPHLRGVLVDLPNASAVAEQLFAERGLTDRTEIVAGTFFDRLPAGHDVYTIARAITDWPDRQATQILARMAEAAGERGRVLIIEVLPTDPQAPYATSFDLEMLATVGGRERTPADFDSIAADAGLVPTRVIRGQQGLVLLEYACASC